MLRVAVLTLSLGCGRVGFVPVHDIDGGDDLDDVLAQLCGDTSGLRVGSPWPLMNGCPTNVGRTSFVGPQTGATALAPTGTSPNRRGAAIDADGNIIIQEYGNGVLHSLDPTSGTERWAQSAISASIEPYPVIDVQNIVYSTTSNGQVFARDAATGTERWSLQLGGAFSPPVMDVAGGFYFGSLGGGGFFAIDTVTRQQRWTYPVPGDIRPSPALANGVVYFVDATNSRLYALDAANGGHIFDVSVPGTASWAPVVGADDVFVATTNGVAAFNRSSGTLEWQQPSGVDVVQPALLADGSLLTSTSYNTTSGVAYVLDRVDGSTLREFPLGATVRGSPRLDRDDTAYFTTDTGIQAFQDAATPLWQSPLTGDIIIGDGSVVVFPLVETLAIIGP